MPRLSNLVRPRSFGFAGQEGELFDMANQNPNSLSSLITNESIQGMRPSNYIQSSGGVSELPQSRDVNLGGHRGTQDSSGSQTFYTESGYPVTITPDQLAAYDAEGRRRREEAALQRRMAEAKVREQEAKAQKESMPSSDATGRKPMTADQEAKYRQKFGEAYGTTISALQSSRDVIKAAQDLSTDPGLEGITGVSGYLWSRPGGKAAAAQQKFETLQGKVTKMAKDAAASSGSIGPMAVQEWKILRDQIEAIDPTKLDAAQMKSVLDDLTTQAENAARITEESYTSTFSPDFERYPQFSNPRAVIQQTANNSQRVPEGAAQMLRANPNLRAQFDAKYGQGASASVLGQ